MNCYTFDEFIEKVYKPKGLTFPIIDLYEVFMQYGSGVTIQVEGEDYTLYPYSQETIKECSPEMNDFINCFAQVV